MTYDGDPRLNTTYDLSTNATGPQPPDPLDTSSVWFQMAYYIAISCPAILCIVGVPFNIANIVIVRHKRKVSSHFAYVTVLSFVDSLLLAHRAANLYLPYTPIPLTSIQCAWTQFVIETSAQMSSWILVALCLERAVVVKFPFSRLTVFTPKRASVSMAAITVVIVLLNTIVLFAVIANQREKTCEYRKEYLALMRTVWYKIDALSYALIPFALLFVFNTIIVTSLHKSSTIQQSMNLPIRRKHGVIFMRHFTNKNQNRNTIFQNCIDPQTDFGNCDDTSFPKLRAHHSHEMFMRSSKSIDIIEKERRCDFIQCLNEERYCKKDIHKSSVMKCRSTSCFSLSNTKRDLCPKSSVAEVYVKDCTNWYIWDQRHPGKRVLGTAVSVEDRPHCAVDDKSKNVTVVSCVGYTQPYYGDGTISGSMTNPNGQRLSTSSSFPGPVTVSQVSLKRTAKSLPKEVWLSTAHQTSGGKPDSVTSPRPSDTPECNPNAVFGKSKTRLDNIQFHQIIKSTVIASVVFFLSTFPYCVVAVFNSFLRSTGTPSPVFIFFMNFSITLRDVNHVANFFVYSMRTKAVGLAMKSAARKFIQKHFNCVVKRKNSILSLFKKSSLRSSGTSPLRLSDITAVPALVEDDAHNRNCVTYV